MATTPPQSHIYILTRRDLIHHTDHEGRYHIIGTFATRKAAIRAAKAHVREQLERVGGREEIFDGDEWGCAIYPSRIEEYMLRIEVERHHFEDGGVVVGGDGDDGDDESGSELDASEDSEEGYDFEIQWRRRRNCWSESEDDPEDDDGDEEPESGEDEEDDEEEEELVVLNPQPGSKRPAPVHDDEVRSVRPRYEP